MTWNVVPTATSYKVYKGTDATTVLATGSFIAEKRYARIMFRYRDDAGTISPGDINNFRIYQYDNVIMADCCNGQTIIIDGAVVNSARSSAIEYEKSNNDQKYRVHYRSLDIVLNECYNEVIEMVVENKERIRDFANVLKEKEEMTGEEINEILYPETADAE